MLWRLVITLFFSGILGAESFTYFINCPALTIGPDTVEAFSSSGTVTLTPNVTLIFPGFHMLHLDIAHESDPFSTTFDATLTCQVTIDGQTADATRSVTMMVNYLRFGGSSFQEQHQYTFQSLLFTVGDGPAGTIVVSEPGLNFNTFGGMVTSFQPALLFTLLDFVPAPIPPPDLLAIDGMFFF
ncbi:MAG TPA: hypothetical protein VEU96_16685 [Bryobacteraceae bacterium]|nr:hypothetical protein [Bryobacteraceae bacterium]